MATENHFNQLMEAGYSILTEHQIAWPKEFTLENKLALLNKTLNYFEVNERYRECAMLSKKIKNLSKVKKGKTAEKVS